MKTPRKYLCRTKNLEVIRTMKAYENRLMALKKSDFECLRNKYISCYDVWDTFQQDEVKKEIEMRYGTKFDNIAFRLYMVATIKNIQMKGITSHKKMRGRRVASLKLGETEEADTFYVGPALNFDDTKLERSIFSLRAEDRRYKENIN